MNHCCAQCGRVVGVVGDGLATMHTRPGRYGNVNKGPERIYQGRDYPEWCPGSGKPVAEAVR